jgi:1,4-alpha-glucan branching enzyme
VAIVSNFTPVPRYRYRVGLPRAGRWREILNSDSNVYGGSGVGNFGEIRADGVPWHGQPASAEIIVPPLATVYFVFDPDQA